MAEISSSVVNGNTNQQHLPTIRLSAMATIRSDTDATKQQLLPREQDVRELPPLSDDVIAVHPQRHIAMATDSF